MFYNYDNDIETGPGPGPECLRLEQYFQATGLALIYDLKGKLLGIEAKHQNPITLFFNVRETTGQLSLEGLAAATVRFNLVGQNHKVALEKVYQPLDVYNAQTSDFAIFLSAAEVGTLKKESYRISLTLEFEDEVFSLFGETDGLLVIR
jgi:hypothetical protein